MMRRTTLLTMAILMLSSLGMQKGDGPCLAVIEDVGPSDIPPGSGIFQGAVLGWNPGIGTNATPPTGSWQYEFAYYVDWYCNGGCENTRQTCSLFLSLEVDYLAGNNQWIQQMYFCSQTPPQRCCDQLETDVTATIPPDNWQFGLKSQTHYRVEFAVAPYNPQYDPTCGAQITDVDLGYIWTFDNPTNPV